MMFNNLIRLERLAGDKHLAYFAGAQITTVKSFITLVPSPIFKNFIQS
jgi:hypothetical protein